MSSQQMDAQWLPQEGETLVFDTNPVLNERQTHYCPGCHHGIAHRLVSEVLHELGVADRTILVASVGCATFTYDYFNVDGLEAPHGRACAVATGVRRARPDAVVFTYQGDGDMAAIGMAESLHAANRGEKITTIFINNTVYGMTGGQMAPTTLLAWQHYNTLLSRMEAFQVKIGMLSRFRTAKQQKETLRGLQSGSVDIVVGTHRLLSKDVVIPRLGLLILQSIHNLQPFVQ